MTIYAITEHQTIHTCPADFDSHPIDIRRTIVHVTPGRECTNLITIRAGLTTVTIPCGRHEPADRQCAGCRTTVVTRSITTTDLGHQDGTGCPPAPSGLNPLPCPACKQPVAALLDRHLFCAPATPRTRSAA